MDKIECPACREIKPIEEFGKASWRKSGISYRCRKCSSKSSLYWARNNPEKVKASSQKTYTRWRENHPLVPRIPLVTAEGRLCRTCNTRKPNDAFAKDVRSKNRRAWRCRECAKAAHTSWRQKNKEHVRDVGRGTARKLREKNPQMASIALRKHRLKSKYGLTLDDVERMLSDQGRECDICRREIKLTSDKVDVAAAHIDHDHKSGKVRGLLCAPCNTALGKFKDNEGLLSAAIEYLRRHSQKS